MGSTETRYFRLSVKPPAGIDPWPDERLEAIFETYADAEAAAGLIRKIYRGQGLETAIEEIRL